MVVMAQRNARKNQGGSIACSVPLWAHVRNAELRLAVILALKIQESAMGKMLTGVVARMTRKELMVPMCAATGVNRQRANMPAAMVAALEIEHHLVCALILAKKKPRAVASTKSRSAAMPSIQKMLMVRTHVGTGVLCLIAHTVARTANVRMLRPGLQEVLELQQDLLKRVLRKPDQLVLPEQADALERRLHAKIVVAAEAIAVGELATV
jgi:hypothetical protein